MNTVHEPYFAVQDVLKQKMFRFCFFFCKSIQIVALQALSPLCPHPLHPACRLGHPAARDTPLQMRPAMSFAGKYCQFVKKEAVCYFKLLLNALSFPLPGPGPGPDSSHRAFPFPYPAGNLQETEHVI